MTESELNEVPLLFTADAHVGLYGVVIMRVGDIVDTSHRKYPDMRRNCRVLERNRYLVAVHIGVAREIGDEAVAVMVQRCREHLRTGVMTEEILGRDTQPEGEGTAQRIEREVDAAVARQFGKNRVMTAVSKTASVLADRNAAAGREAKPSFNCRQRVIAIQNLEGVKY